jgi:catalase (peroxidase I)
MATWRVLAKAHDLRNLAEYEGHVDVEERFVRDLIVACERVSAEFDVRQ